MSKLLRMSQAYLPISLLFLTLFSQILSGCSTMPPKQRPEYLELEKQRRKEFAKQFEWWPSDAKPDPVEDKERNGYWWWPTIPGEKSPWGNRGYVFIHKIIFDEEGKPYLILKRVVRNVNVYFDYNKADLREDAKVILDEAAEVMKRDQELSLLLTGGADQRGTDEYNLQLAGRRAQTARDYMISLGIPEERITILSRGELDAVAPVTDLVGMQKDRKVHFMVAEVEQVQVPEDQKPNFPEGTVLEEEKNLESSVKVTTRKYIVEFGDSLWSIAEREYGNGGQWHRIYDFNRDRLGNPGNLKPGMEIEIPIE